MKVVILAGGFGTRISEESHLKPKPMIEIGGKPILWHIMNIYACQGVKEFVIAVGYKAEVIKEYFLNFYAINNDISIDLATGAVKILAGKQPNWKVHIVDTGLYTQTGGRLKRIRSWLEDDEEFFFTYGDGLADVDIGALLRFHRAHGKLATMTTVLPPARFGRITFKEDQIVQFHEKPIDGEGRINGGYFVLNRRAIDYINDDETIWERAPLEHLAGHGELMGYRHDGFWSCMDTIKEKSILEELWISGKAPWKIWE
ncbi:glucose-1-phosphate cytidylyltransferase [Candidatus Manganitrophus noduliformans]|uniref:Glucose-1-phosphate cytidylyltransferase n=1 Tax=Candidatus Manganitrophus noduliformans TaxID=2606439 RepID=A0A7X6DS81_9BACT|nr:glucose-1-phosphate cytidylyltransferase [Candidatus Manganitrophus noduliformans]NKE72108.1 glucose-1-phosphate cytidylyltransferase [Candidatus Manganitrophus noduliformans]